MSQDIVFFLKTQDFIFHGCEIKLSHHTSAPQDIVRVVSEHFARTLKKGVQYRATGITLLKLQSGANSQLDLFGSVLTSQGLQRVFESVDALSERYGKHAVFLGSSLQAMKQSAHAGERGSSPERAKNLFKGETKRRRLAIPFLGQAS